MGSLINFSDRINKTSLKIGSLIFMSGYGKESEKLAVYKIENSHYYYVSMETLRQGVATCVKPYSQKFGIGYYYNDQTNPCISEDEVSNLLIDAHKLYENQQIEANKAKELRKQKIEQGKAKLNIPEGACTVIVAELHENVSDTYSDYFHSKAVKVVYLAFSKTKRDNFNEMRKAALKFEETAFLADSKDYENREKYSGGHGYYLAESRYSGWQVSKTYINEENLALAIMDGRFYCDEEQAPKKAITTNEPAEEKQPVQEEKKLPIEIVDYSLKAVAVFGETKPLKDQLSAMGGRFNGYLTNPTTGEKMAGWVFPMAKKDSLMQFQLRGF